MALRWTRLSCHAFRHNAVRLQLHALAYNLANFLRSLALPRGGRAVVADDACARSWSRSAPGSCATAATSSSSSPRWRCRGRCSPRSCAGSTACEDRPWRRPDGSGPWGGQSRGENHAPKVGRARRKPPGRPAARSRIAHADRGRSFGGSSVDAQPFEEHRRTRERRLSGRCRLRATAQRRSSSTRDETGSGHRHGGTRRCWLHYPRWTGPERIGVGDHVAGGGHARRRSPRAGSEQMADVRLDPDFSVNVPGFDLLNWAYVRDHAPASWTRSLARRSDCASACGSRPRSRAQFATASPAPRRRARSATTTLEASTTPRSSSTGTIARTPSSTCSRSRRRRSVRRHRRPTPTGC